jgi:MFS family permease
MNSVREKKLEKNFSRLFWIQAFSTVRVFSIISVLLFLHRGLTLSQVFYLSIVWSIINLIFEIPSSYLADKWGRKKTIILGTAFNLIFFILLILARSFPIFILAYIFSALQFALFSGTIEALVYDTNKELNQESDSLKKLGNFHSARHLFKIITPIVAVLIAKDLQGYQFNIIILIDLIATITALIISFKLIEANHYIDVEKQEANIIKDAFKLIKKDWQLTRAILSRVIIFTAIFIMWRFHQKFFIDIDISIITLGIMGASINIIVFAFYQNIMKFVHSKNLTSKINILNYLVAFFLTLFVISTFMLTNKYWLLIIYGLIITTEVMRWPLYSELYNKKSFSFNRATTLSLSNFLKSILDIPLIFIASVLIGININYPFIFSLTLVIIVIIFFRIPKRIEKT